jgi:hypothetical protein
VIAELTGGGINLAFAGRRSAAGARNQRQGMPRSFVDDIDAEQGRAAIRGHAKPGSIWASRIAG